MYVLNATRPIPGSTLNTRNINDERDPSLINSLDARQDTALLGLFIHFNGHSDKD